jgi:hypothetical protein
VQHGSLVCDLHRATKPHDQTTKWERDRGR